MSGLQNSKISILDYNACNITSVYNAFYNLGADVKVIRTKEDLLKSDKLVIPGVGAAYNSINYLKKNFLFDGIQEFILKERPILGICLGLQMFLENLYEHGKSNGLGLINGDVVEFASDSNFGQFNIGWSTLNISDELSKILNIRNKSYFYFCHSFYIKLKSEKNMKVGSSKFSVEFPALILKNNFLGTQFHPEKSQSNGTKIIDKFINWKP